MNNGGGSGFTTARPIGIGVEILFFFWPVGISGAILPLRIVGAEKTHNL